VRLSPSTRIQDITSFFSLAEEITQRYEAGLLSRIYKPISNCQIKAERQLIFHLPFPPSGQFHKS
jgi:hypothetical protein